jgi:general transcription factor 3C polypeptide 3 (transcription factor C subunit 4)
MPLTGISFLSGYLLQAYDAQPRDAMICLDLAVACLGRAMQRQADNRHHLIVEVGMIFSPILAVVAIIPIP